MKSNIFPVEKYPKVQKHLEELHPGSRIVDSWIISYYTQSPHQEVIKDPENKWRFAQLIGANVKTYEKVPKTHSFEIKLYQNGSLSSTRFTDKLNLPESTDYSYFESGKIHGITNFKFCKKEGPCLEYYLNGNLYREKNYF